MDPGSHCGLTTAIQPGSQPQQSVATPRCEVHHFIVEIHFGASASVITPIVYLFFLFCLSPLPSLDHFRRMHFKTSADRLWDATDIYLLYQVPIRIFPRYCQVDGSSTRLWRRRNGFARKNIFAIPDKSKTIKTYNHNISGVVRLTIIRRFEILFTVYDTAI